MDALERTNEFLKRYGMHPDCVNIGVLVSSFIAEMDAGLEGKNSSLAMLPTYLAPGGTPPDGEPVIAVDAGGTNLRVALTEFHGGRLEILYSDVSPMPGSHGRISKEEFLRQVAERILPVADRSGKIGVCFSYSAEILPNRDGRLNAFSKEVEVSDSEGMEICRELSRKLREIGCIEPKKFVLLNDTTAVLLGGTSELQKESFDGGIGFVLGTGTNLCYNEETSKIKRLIGGYMGRHMIVNTESGDFDAAHFGVIDQEFDKTTVNSGKHRFEKMIGGRYLGPLILTVLKRAAEAGLFSVPAASSLLATADLPLPEANEFLKSGGGSLRTVCQNGDDAAVIRAVADSLFARAAKLAAACVAAAIEKTGAGSRMEKPALVVAEGSTFWKLYTFPERFKKEVSAFITGKKGRYCRIVSAESATLKGCCLAALLNDYNF